MDFRMRQLCTVAATALICAQPINTRAQELYGRLEVETTPSIDKSTTVEQVAQETPDRPVVAQVEFQTGTTPESLADLVFSRRVLAMTAFMKDESAYNFSVLGPSKAEQLARAHCEYPHASGSQDPRDVNRIVQRSGASTMLTAAEAMRWVKQPPAPVVSIHDLQVPTDQYAARIKEIMRNVFTLRVPSPGNHDPSPECAKYILKRP